jgi:hypothetical protein
MMETVIIYPYEIRDPFILWEIDFIDPLEYTHTGNLYLIMIIDYIISKVFVYPLMIYSSEVITELLQEIIWIYGRSIEIVIDNDDEFRTDEFQVV